MDDAMLDERFALCREVIAQAGALALDYFEALDSLTIKHKGPQDVVSEADVETERLVRDRLLAAFPGDGFLGEESGPGEEPGPTAAAADRGLWVVDPIDGTQPFVSGLPNWCVSIGFLHAGTVAFGCVLDPCNRELFAAKRGRPATLNDRPIRPHAATDLRSGLTSVGYSRRVAPAVIVRVIERLLGQGGMFHRNGSGALCLCHVACGRLLGYVEPHINAWDCAGAIAVLEGAGARVSDFFTGDALAAGNRIVAGPPALFGALEALLDD